jgi:hypothetical protein
MNSYVWNFLPYSSQELREYLESQFTPWMNWKNLGVYKKYQWDDSIPQTWVWQIDHIIPQGAFLFTSLEDDAFKWCWSLDNLRPLSAKENSLKNRKLVL